MPRKPRFFLPNIPVHVVVRGNARQVVFVEDSDKQAYLGWLKEASEKEKVSIHAYVLMDNHVHILLSTNEPRHISRVMQHIGRKYVPYFNHKYGKSGTLWEGRFKGSMIESEQYLLCCYRYIELNPVRANMVKKPEEWKWSSYACNAYGENNPLIRPHEVYLAIDKDEEKRVEYYRASFRQVLDSSLINDLRSAVQTGTPLGNDKFKVEVEKILGVKVGYAKRGRPKRTNLL
jgi:putative transposase